jgi:tetratricopeptide (TPR) repeat protein
MTVIEYLILGLSTLFTIAWCLQLRHKVKYQQQTEKAKELQGFLMTASILLVYFGKISALHLLWMIPASFIVGLLSIATPLKILWIFSSTYFFFWYLGISNSGRRFYLQGEYEKAITEFTNQIKKKPNSPEPYFNLGLTYGKLGEYEKEVGAYEEVIKLQPKKPETYLNLATAYNEMGNKEKAIDTFRDAIALNSKYLKAHYMLCKLYAETGNTQNALKELEIVNNLDPTTAKDLEMKIRSNIVIQ